ncbi:MAG: hypothetical protein EOP19_07535 [Hyphomicrobiales bacterium]|nr:MAG: hypothetical protein EOP19_07535 [Hyphomicrobiales bacterium]
MRQLIRLACLAIAVTLAAPVAAFEIEKLKLDYRDGGAAALERYWGDYVASLGYEPKRPRPLVAKVTAGGQSYVYSMLRGGIDVGCGIRECPVRIFQGGTLIVETMACDATHTHGVSPDGEIFYRCDIGRPLANMLLVAPSEARTTRDLWADAAERPWNHNGSVMQIDPAAGTIVYLHPKASLSATVRPGQVLFEGTPWTPGGAFSGTAYTFRKGCPPAPYTVTATYEDFTETLTLRGDAPVRRKGGCEVVSYSSTSSNAMLAFHSTFD